MKCPNCGAEANGRYCEFCGSQMPEETKTVNIVNNYYGNSAGDRETGSSTALCPQCGGNNLAFQREAGPDGYNRTVGLCHNCGYTWYPSVTGTDSQKSNLTLWILGWIFFFPIPVMVLIWRKKNTWDVKVKIAVTVVFWLIVFGLGHAG